MKITHHPVMVRIELYEQLLKIKTGTPKSFSDVIKEFAEKAEKYDRLKIDKLAENMLQQKIKEILQ